MDIHFTIPVKNLEESKKFYEKLGFKKFNNWEKPEQKLKAYWIKDKFEHKIELTYHPTNKNIKFPEIVEVQHFGIEVKDLMKKVKELQNSGVEVIIPITKGVSVKQFAFIKDPNGFPIELVER